MISSLSLTVCVGDPTLCINLRYMPSSLSMLHALLVVISTEVRTTETVGPVLIHVITNKGQGYSPAEVAQVGLIRLTFWA